MSDKQELLEAIATFQALAERLPDSDPEQAPDTNGFMTEALLSRLTGFSVSRLETMRRRGDVVKGVHWFTNPKGAVVWDKEAFDQWQRGMKAADTKAYKFEQTGLSVYASNGKRNGSGRVSTLEPRQPVSNGRRR